MATKFAPRNNIFGLEEEARENIKQEETKVLVNLSKLLNVFVKIAKYLVYKKYQKERRVFGTISLVSHSQRQGFSCVYSI